MAATKPESDLFTVREAAFLADLSVAAVEKVVEREGIGTTVTGGAGGGPGRRLGVPEALYLRLRSGLAPRVRRELYRGLRGTPPERLPRRFESGDLVLDLARPVDRLLRRCVRLRDIWDRVDVLPLIYDGEPFLRGTRVPVHLVAKSRSCEESLGRLRERFPFLTDDDLDACFVYARLYPRRGRNRERWGRALNSDMGFATR